MKLWLSKLYNHDETLHLLLQHRHSSGSLPSPSSPFSSCSMAIINACANCKVFLAGAFLLLSSLAVILSIPLTKLGSRRQPPSWPALRTHWVLGWKEQATYTLFLNVLSLGSFPNGATFFQAHSRRWPADSCLSEDALLEWSLSWQASFPLPLAASLTRRWML